MKHKFIGKKELIYPYFLLEVQLTPETEKEKVAIQKVEQLTADDEQKELIENYLLFGLQTSYSILSIEQQTKETFILKAAIH